MHEHTNYVLERALDLACKELACKDLACVTLESGNAYKMKFLLEAQESEDQTELSPSNTNCFAASGSV